MEEKPKYPIQTVSNAIEILNYLALDSGNRGVGITEISNALGMGKSAVHRILDTLLYYGFVDKNFETSRYRLGWGLYSIGQHVPQQNQIFNLDRDCLIELSRKTGETVNLGVLNRNETVLISKIEGNSSGLRVNIQAGEREAIHATALGKVLISEMQDDAICELLSDRIPLQKFTENTITNVDDLLNELCEVRKRGYATDEEEYGIGIICMSCPVRDYTGRIIAAVSVSTPSSRMDENHRELILTSLKECSNYASWSLGYRP